MLKIIPMMGAEAGRGLPARLKTRRWEWVPACEMVSGTYRYEA